MNYGSIGGLSLLEQSKYAFYFRREVYSAFSLNDGSKLYGLYYPCPPSEKDKQYAYVTLKHDLFLTPIPVELWKASARIRVYLNNAPGTLNELCAYLKDKDVSIIHSESTRSSFRYSTWSLHIVFDKLVHDKKCQLEYNKEFNYYNQTKQKLDKLISDFEEKKENCLFKLRSKDRVKGDPNYTLAFFAKYLDSPENNKTFTLTVVDPDKSHRRRTLDGDEAFANIMNDLGEDFIPATTFSEIDTNELNLRTTLIPEEDVKRFFKVAINYQCEVNNDKNTYVGIIHRITECMPLEYNIWHSYDRTINNNPEKGQIVFLIEDETRFLTKEGAGKVLIKDRKGRQSHYLRGDMLDSLDYQKRAFKEFERIVKFYNDQKLEFKFSDPEISSMPTAGVMKEIVIEESKGGEFEFDLFISYSHSNKEFVDNLEEFLTKKGIDCHVDRNEIKSGDQLNDIILTNIRKSREMCVIVSKESINSVWMPVERGAAWSLGKTISAVIKDEDVTPPEILTTTLHVPAYEPNALEKYAEDIIYRRNKYLGKKYDRTFFK